MDAVGKAPAITRRDSFATLPPRVQGEAFASCVRAHAGTTLRAIGCLPF